MTKTTPHGEDKLNLGPLASDIFFLTRTFQAVLRPAGQEIRNALNIEDGVIGILCLIWLNPGISQNQLASSLILKKSAVTKLVASLENDGIVARQRVEHDRRRNALTLTSKGHQLVSGIRKVSENVQADVFAGIAVEDQAVFFAVMRKLLKNSGYQSGESQG